MAITLAQAQELSQSKLTQDVILEFRKSPILDMIPFDNTIKPQGGDSLVYSYNRVTTMGTAAVRAINAEYTPQEQITQRVNVDLKVFGGSFNIDRVLAKHEQQVLNHVDAQIKAKSEAAIALFNELFITGDSAGDAREFDGLAAALASSSTEVTPSGAINLSSSANIDSNYKAFMDALDAWLALLDGVPGALLMNRSMRAIMSGVARRSGSFTQDEDAFGRPVTLYAGIPLIGMGEIQGTNNPIIPTDVGTGETDIYAVRFGLDGVHAVSPDGSDVVSVYLPDLTTAGAVKTGEVEMVAAIALKNSRAAGVLHRIQVA